MFTLLNITRRRTPPVVDWPNTHLVIYGGGIKVGAAGVPATRGAPARLTGHDGRSSRAERPRYDERPSRHGFLR